MPRGVPGSGDKGSKKGQQKAPPPQLVAPSVASLIPTPIFAPPTFKKSGRNPLAAAETALEKVLKGDDPTVQVDYHQLKHSRPFIPTGSLVLDYLIGGAPNMFGVPPCPGWPRGALSNLYGHESSGKTTLALHAAAQVIANGGTVCYIDWEFAIDQSYAQALGVPISNRDKFRLMQPNSLETGIQVLHTMAAAGVDLIVLDSVGAGRPKVQVEKSAQEKGGGTRIGLVAQKWSDYLPELAKIVADSGSHVMGLSQLRKKISTGPMAGVGDSTTVQGGEAWKFYSAVRMKLQRTMSHKSKVYNALKRENVEQFTSATIKAKIDKCKVAATQQHEATFFIEFGFGVDDLRSMIEIAKVYKILRTHGTGGLAMPWNGGEITGASWAAFKAALKAEPAAKAALLNQVALALKAAATTAPAASLEDDTGILSTLPVFGDEEADGESIDVAEPVGDDDEN